MTPRTRIIEYVKGLPNLRLINQYGTVYNFPQSFTAELGPASVNSSINKKLYAHGGAQTGDKFLKPRVVTVKGSLYADNITLMETAFRALCKACYQGGSLSLVGDTVSRSIQVEAPNIDDKWKRFPNDREIAIDFQTQFPFWIDTTETDDDFTVTGNDDFNIDNSASDHVVLPVIEIVADQGVDVPSVRLRNVNDGGIVFEYNDPLFVAGSILSVDSQTGECRMNNNESHDKIIRGGFLRLQNMVNTIYYEGAACTIHVKYRKIYT